jgi:membrane protein DedA with SNARE-associated domain
MAKINFNLLRQRINWVDDYAAGIKWSDLLAKYESEGIKPGRLQSAIEAAQKIGIISVFLCRVRQGVRSLAICGLAVCAAR